MVSAPGSTKTKRILLGRSGSENSFGQLADGLRAEGFKVVEEKSSPVGAHSTSKAITEVLQGIDIVLLVVHKNDGIAGPTPPFERVLHDAKIIQDSIGEDNVVLLVEESVDGLPETGMSHIRFPTSRADMILQDVVNKIDITALPPVRDKHARIPMSEQAMSSALRVPWLLVFVVLLSAAIPIAIALNSLRGENDGEQVESTARITGLVAVLGQGLSSDGDAEPVAGQSAESTSQAEAPADGAGQESAGTAVDPPTDPAAPVVTLGGDNALLPATCEIDVTGPTLSDGAIGCDGPGRLLLDGRDGPWHNEIRAVAVADGVIGELRYEAPARGSTNGPSVVELSSGTVVLNEADAAIGVSGLTVRFSAHGQHVHLFADPDGTGEFATLTFSLGR